MKEKVTKSKSLTKQGTINMHNNVNDLPLVMHVEDLMSILSIGRNAAYSLVRSGQIRSFRIGRCYRITKDAVKEYLEKASISARTH